MNTASTFPYITGLNIVPTTGEFSYDPIPHRNTSETSALNCYSDGSMKNADAKISLDAIKQKYPQVTLLNIVVSWFCDSIDASLANVFPSTIYPNQSQEMLIAGSWTNDDWIVSGIVASDSNMITINASDYSGTPSDQSIIRCIQYAKTLGFNVAFYPKLMMTATLNTKADITFTPDQSQAATNAVESFVGTATPQMFSTSNGSIQYSGDLHDWSYARMIYHYAALCAYAGGVSTFYVGSGLCGLESIRGPSWSEAGSLDPNGFAVWDYPFVAELNNLVSNARTMLPSAKISYSVDWRQWMGCYHNNNMAKIPHLDQLYTNLDFISINNYAPISDWTNTGGLDEVHWGDTINPVYPPSASTMNALGLSGTPSVNDLNYLQANIEGGEQYGWYYTDNTFGSPEHVSGNAGYIQPNGDRGAQARNTYAIGQNLLAVKRYRWWWNNTHQAVYDAHDGRGIVAHGPTTQWMPNSKSITFPEYGFPCLDKITNKPGAFIQNQFEPYWNELFISTSITPIRDKFLCMTAYQAIYDYWLNNNSTVNGIEMIDMSHFAIWNYDIRSNIKSNAPWNVSVWSTNNWIYTSLK